jgi:hypothetical protein
VLTGGARWRGAEQSRSAKAAEQSLRWEHEEEEEKDLSFSEGIMQRIRCVKRLATHMGVVGKGGGVRQRLRSQVLSLSGVGACWPLAGWLGGLGLVSHSGGPVWPCGLGPK